MSMWLIRNEVALAMRQARRAGFTPTAEQIADLNKTRASASAGQPRSLSVAGEVAQINVHGALTKQPDFWALWFGGGNTSYTDMTAALAAASADPRVKRVVLDIDSPGGEVDGLFDFLAALEAFDKPIITRAAQACSAAYAIACITKTIEATNPAAGFGSIGVAASFWVLDDIVDITSTEAPDKRPDLSTEEGQAVVRKHLDDIHGLFVDGIARGRGTTADKVNATYGRGAVLLAAEAKRLGMIDSIAKPALRAVSSSRSATAEPGGTQTKRVVTMTEEELRQQHPATYEAVFNKGKKAGEDALHDLVTAHLVAGEASGDMKTATDAIKARTPMTQTLQTQYMMAAANRSDRNSRQDDSNKAGEATDRADQATPTQDMGDLVVAEMLKKRGK